MFDPSIFENVKVVLEGHIYDLDLANKLLVIGRKDLMDLADLSRTFAISFQLPEKYYAISGEIILYSSLHDFALEKINNNDKTAGCDLHINFYQEISSTSICKKVEETLQKIWDNRPSIKQEICFQIDNPSILSAKISLHFNRKINEQQIDDLSIIIERSFYSLKKLAHLTTP